LISSNDRFANALRTVFHQQAREVRAYATGPAIAAGHKVDLSHWQEAMRRVLRPFLLDEIKLGMSQAVRSLQHQGIDVNVRTLWGDMRAKLEEDLDRVVRESNRTYQDRLNDRLRELKRAVKRGEMTPLMAKHDFVNFLYTDFATELRAARLIDTEQVRALNAGKKIVMGEGGMTEKTWHAEPGACPFCFRLHGKTVGIDKPFAVRPEGGPYAVVNEPPDPHPGCNCSVSYG
jgi:hypothetical protein